MDFLLDTNVVSELMRTAPAVPAPQVLAWFARNTGGGMYTSAITQAEILAGIALLPEGKRRNALAGAAEQMFEQEFAERCLAFDSVAAQHYALAVARRTAVGWPISTEDGQIAAIALAAGLPLVTRNTKDFIHIEGLTVIDPWQAH
ncbi:type II toxin-antitoxin system VapC family toxin [Comamonas flocculans]|uniref:Ribonuclease VapC n=1 Tax=Comamonas flocculans TaxID=2597701 RepID=A0A5B8RUN0_9BURK|nr:type II toxin-antitoxin system VapC family toxin [Comamonas flocculans]QEA13256.1 type II toxin-antitoxin system VapC family toxin [Comamonas flocculans]